MRPVDYSITPGPDESTRAVQNTAHPGRAVFIDGWLASHNDRGTPGPHLQVRSPDGGPVVLHTGQLDRFIDQLRSIARRTDRRWRIYGESFTEEVVCQAPHPEDPEVIARTQRDHAAAVQRIRECLPEVVAILMAAEDCDPAIEQITALLGMSEFEVMRHLRRFNLLAMTGAATEHRVAFLAE